MSERALEFVENWVDDTIEKMGNAKSAGKTQADALAAQCVRDAGREGIAESEIKDAFDDLAAYIASEIDARKHRPEEGLNFIENDDARIIDEEEDEAAGDK